MRVKSGFIFPLVFLGLFELIRAVFNWVVPWTLATDFLSLSVIMMTLIPASLLVVAKVQEYLETPAREREGRVQRVIIPKMMAILAFGSVFMLLMRVYLLLANEVFHVAQVAGLAQLFTIALLIVPCSLMVSRKLYEQVS
ncbi:hypothetical protein [Shouchella shacheensis]|uniref:hypothetical protein n=1 Tax=Shouchella shacheensis TaxID=1649580 RepID=UPI0007402B0B|nr:hypothetical protein [Shouchella shacheensis]